MNILIKLTCLIGLVVAPILGGHADETTLSKTDAEEMVFISDDGKKTILTNKVAKQEISKEIKVEMTSEGEASKAIVTIETTKNGETTSETKTFTGTPEEVKAQVDALKEDGIKVDAKKIIKVVEEEVN